MTNGCQFREHKVSDGARPERREISSGERLRFVRSVRPLHQDRFQNGFQDGIGKPLPDGFILHAPDSMDGVCRLALQGNPLDVSRSAAPVPTGERRVGKKPIRDTTVKIK